ncbi:MAG TPA: hypothetical protein PKD00_00055 [Burkholderiales bacterium]|nr:hypothetical protein [Burkholderiales bacterium]
MKNLNEFDDDYIFGTGTIIIIKNTDTLDNKNISLAHVELKEDCANQFTILDLHVASGRYTNVNLPIEFFEGNGVTKKLIISLVNQHIKYFYKNYIEKDINSTNGNHVKKLMSLINDLIYIETWDNYIKQVNPDLFFKLPSVIIPDNDFIDNYKL